MNVLCVVAHPDDETLGCGGTLALHASAGDVVSIQTFTDGVSSRYGKKGDEARRIANFYSAIQALGLLPRGQIGSFHEDLIDQKLDMTPSLALVQRVEHVIAQCQPEIVYTHHPRDLNADHRAVSNAVLVATRPVPGCIVRSVLAFETPSSTEWSFGLEPAFRPSLFVDITDTQIKKCRAMECYVDEVRNPPHPRAIDRLLSLAAVRGAQAGVHAAEAFEVLRWIGLPR